VDGDFDGVFAESSFAAASLCGVASASAVSQGFSERRIGRFHAVIGDLQARTGLGVIILDHRMNLPPPRFAA
jgi:hypothetical protein